MPKTLVYRLLLTQIAHQSSAKLEYRAFSKYFPDPLAASLIVPKTLVYRLLLTQIAHQSSAKLEYRATIFVYKEDIDVYKKDID